jgi:LPXTG-site transpeptidase (sortase) family protein
VPLRAGAARAAQPETSTTRRARAARRRRRARQIARRRAVALACLVGALVALAAGVHLLITPAESSLANRGTAGQAEAAAASNGTYARPVRLIIPKIGLDAAIEDVGLTADEAMAAPSGPDTVGWYRFGPRPGNSGSAVMDGHSGYADGRAAAFDDLSELGKGDRLYVEDVNGRRASFVVRTTRLYARDADAATVFAPTTSLRLNLITCTGTFDVAAGTHSQRLVVFTDLEVPERVARQQ